MRRPLPECPACYEEAFFCRLMFRLSQLALVVSDPALSRGEVPGFPPGVTAVTGGHGKRQTGRQETGPGSRLGSSVTRGPWASQLLHLKGTHPSAGFGDPFPSPPPPVCDSRPAPLRYMRTCHLTYRWLPHAVFLLSASFTAGQRNTGQSLL